LGSWGGKENRCSLLEDGEQMSDLGTISILVDIRGQPLVKELATDLNSVAVSERKVSDGTKKVIEDFKRMQQITAMLKKETDAASTSFQRFSVKELQQTSQRLKGLESVLSNTRRGMGQMGVVVQQAGYQVGDFLVQIQSGTNPLVAFGQQATQLVGILPLMGAGFMGLSSGALVALSAGLGIAIPLVTAIGAAFMRTSGDANNAIGGVLTYAGAISALTEEIRKNKEESLKLKFDTESLGVAGANQQIEDLEKKIASLSASIEKMKSFGGKAAAFAGLTVGTVQELEAQKKTLQDQLDILSAQNEAQSILNGDLSTAAGIQKGLIYDKEVELRLAKDLNSLNQAVSEGLADPEKKLMIQQDYQRLLEAGVKPTQAMADAQYQTQAYLLESAIASGELNNQQLLTAQAALQILDATYLMEGQISSSAAETSLLESGMSQAAISVLQIAGVDISSGVSAAAAAAANLAANMGIALSDAISLVNLRDSKVYSGRGGDPKDFMPGGSKSYTTNFKPFVAPEIHRGGGGGGGGAAKDTQTAIEKLQEQLAVEKELLGTSEAYQRVRQALGDDFKTTSPEIIAGLVQQATETERLIALEEQRKQIMETVKNSVENALMSMVDGTQSVKDAFKSMAAEIIKELYRIYVVQKIVGAVTGAFEGGVGFFSAPATGSFGLPFGGARASGGPVDPSKAYLVGEKGPELVVPRSSGTVVNANQTAKAMGGGGSNAVTVNNNITVTGSDAAMVRAEVAKMIPQITNATKAAVIDARLRGGQMKQAFR